MVWTAHSTKVWRRNFGHCKRQWTQICFPLRSVTGAIPAYLQFISIPEQVPLLIEGGQQARGELRAGTDR
jgi:hypothetical protein